MNSAKEMLIDLFRFLNLLEPGKNIISISKTYMWLMLVVLVHVMFYQPDNLLAIMGAVGAQFMTTTNYIFRRYMGSKVNANHTEPSVQQNGPPSIGIPGGVIPVGEGRVSE